MCKAHKVEDNNGAGRLKSLLALDAEHCPKSTNERNSIVEKAICPICHKLNKLTIEKKMNTDLTNATGKH